jgi:hypothetical protein
MQFAVKLEFFCDFTQAFPPEHHLPGISTSELNIGSPKIDKNRSLSNPL